MQRRQYWAKMLAAPIVAALAGSLGLASAAGASVRPYHHHLPAGRDLHAPLPPGVVASSITNVTQTGSFNWSGYAQNTSTSGTFTAAKDTWRVPTVNTAPSGNQYSSDWVGIDGFSNTSLVQCGTEADNIGHTAVYRAWTEILPASEVVITGLAIHPGDKIFAEVVETSPNTWQMKVKDLTTGKSGSKTVSYTTPGASVEAIHERPTVGGSLATLSHDTNVTFDPGDYSTAPPGTQSWQPLMNPASSATVYQIFMVNNADTKIISSPSLPDSDNDGFKVGYGATSPAPPSS